jgi:hypothetical protein
MVVRRTLPQRPRVTATANVIDPELDMRRSSEFTAGTLERLREIFCKLIRKGRKPVSPMRSIGRELEESWPAGEL